MKNLKLVFLPLVLAFFAPFISHGAGKKEERRFGDYRVTLSQDFESGIGMILINKGKRKVFEESEFGNHYSFGNSFDETGLKQKTYGDITGNGIPDLIISNWTGGAHCCHFLSIFELGKRFKKIVTVQANSSSVRLVDLTGDGYPEVEFWEGAIDYLFASYAQSPAGKIILKFNKVHYEISPDLMKKMSPSLDDIKSVKTRVSDAFRNNERPNLPYEFLKIMMDLSYSGRHETALNLANELWPKDKPGLNKFKLEFSQALSESPYWKSLYDSLSL